ncbi:unnamed protein product, partial [Adineta steineri]
VDELTTMLESLPSYEHSKETQEESAIFEDDNEPSTGLINLIRKTSMHSSQTITTNEISNAIVADDSTSYYSADDDTTTSGTNSTPIAISTNTEEEIIEDNDEEINMNLLKITVIPITQPSVAVAAKKKDSSSDSDSSSEDDKKNKPNDVPAKPLSTSTLVV